MLNELFFIPLEYIGRPLKTLYEQFYEEVNSLPNNKTLDKSKLKAFADDKIRLCCLEKG